MRTVVDTPIWSLSFRRVRHTPDAQAIVLALSELITSGDAVLLGAVRQEVLSGIGDEGRYRELRDHLRSLPDAPVTRSDFEVAAQYFNDCRRHGIAATGTDMLLCAVSSRLDAPVFTLDGDFARYSVHLPVTIRGLGGR